MIELNTLRKSLDLIQLGLSNLPTDKPSMDYIVTIKELKAIIRRESLRNVLLSDDVGLTAQDCAWITDAKEGDQVVLKGGKTPARIESIIRNMGVVSDDFTIRLANMETLNLSCDELAAYYLPVPSLAQPAPVAWAGYHIMTDKVEIFTSEKSAIDWRDQYKPGFACVEKLVSGGVVE